MEKKRKTILLTMVDKLLAASSAWAQAQVSQATAYQFYSNKFPS
jgi:hypothetical protein